MLRDTGAVLPDASAPPRLESAIREKLETGGDRIADLHLWRVGPGHCAAIVSLVTHHPQPLQDYKRRLAALETLDHISIEIQTCSD